MSPEAGSVRTFIVPLQTRKEVATHTIEVTFDMRHTAFSFTAGHYATITLPQVTDGYTLDKTHDFSIASSPLSPDYLSIIFRQSESIFKRALLTMPIGDKVEIEAPKGVFTLPEDVAKKIVCVAGGVGITPFLSMARSLSNTFSSERFSIFSYDAARDSAVYADELEKAGREGHITFYPHYGPFDGSTFGQQVNLADPALELLIAGPPGFVAAVRTFLEQEGMPYNKIRTEEFSGYQHSQFPYDHH